MATRKSLVVGADGLPQQLQATDALDASQDTAFGASGVTHAKGAVPDPGAAAGTTRALFEDGTWKVPTGGAATVTEVEIDFGAVPSRGQAFTITDAAIAPTSKIVPTQSGAAATGKDADENEMDALILSASPGTGQFTLFATPYPGPVTGKFKINYMVG